MTLLSMRNLLLLLHIIGGKQFDEETVRHKIQGAPLQFVQFYCVRNFVLGLSYVYGFWHFHRTLTETSVIR